LEKQTNKVENMVCTTLDLGTTFKAKNISESNKKETVKNINEFGKIWKPDNTKQYERKNKKVILLGTANTLKITPWDQKDVDYWACAPVMTYKESFGHRIDLLFEMHFMEYWVQIIDRLNEYTVKNPETYIYMQESVPQVKNSLKYPLKKLQNDISNQKLKTYFTSTIAFMIALAGWMGYEDIELYGIHMAADEEEYSMQRSCCESWLNYWHGKTGINYWLPDESSVMSSSYIYGYEQEKGLLLLAMNHKRGLQNGVTELTKRFEALKEELYMQKGAVAGIEQYIRTIKK